MRKQKLTLVPRGGLTDRLKVIASAVHKALEKETPLEIIWYLDERLYCPSYRLFTLSPHIAERGISIREASRTDWFLNFPPEPLNGYLSYPAVFFRYDRWFPPHEVEYLLKHKPKLLQDYFHGHERILLSSDLSLGDHSHIFEYIEPTVEVKNAFRSNLSGWTDNVVGVHLDAHQQQDHSHLSSIDLFIKRMQNMVEDDPSVTFFIASDMVAERERLSVIFSGRVIMSHTISSVDSPKGCINAFGELLALAQTKYILSTKGGTFSQVATLIHDIPLETLSIYSE